MEKDAQQLARLPTVRSVVMTVHPQRNPSCPLTRRLGALGLKPTPSKILNCTTVSGHMGNYIYL